MGTAEVGLRVRVKWFSWSACPGETVSWGECPKVSVMVTVHAPPRSVPTAPVLRRRSPLDPPPGSWAVVGVGAHGREVLSALDRSGIPAVGYEVAAGPEGSPVRWGHKVIAIEEIDDIDSLAVTSRAAGEITTDYYSGVVICVGAYDDWDFIDPETLNVCAEGPVLAHRMFTPRHPAIIVSGPDSDPGLEHQAQLIAAFAGALRDHPRTALSFHRRACARLLPGWPRVTTDPAAGRDYEEVLAEDLAQLRGAP